MRRVVVTGLGATTPLGGDVASSWANLLAGKSGISTLEQEWVARFELPVTFAGQAKVAASEILTPQEAKRLDPSSQFALIAARQAWEDAGTPEVEPERLAVDFATGIGGVWTICDSDQRKWSCRYRSGYVFFSTSSCSIGGRALASQT